MHPTDWLISAQVAGRTVVRFLCAAYLAAFAGLRDSHYDVEQVLLPFVQRHGPFTTTCFVKKVSRGAAATSSPQIKRGAAPKYAPRITSASSTRPRLTKTVAPPGAYA